MSDDKKPVTVEVMRAYIDVLEKQVSQMSLVVKTLEELNYKLEKVEGHFHNGFRTDIKDHVAEQISSVSSKIDTISTTLYVAKENLGRAAGAEEKINKQAAELANDIKDKIGALKSDMGELKSAIKVDRITNIVGWSVFISSILTMILRLWGKI